MTNLFARLRGAGRGETRYSVDDYLGSVLLYNGWAYQAGGASPHQKHEDIEHSFLGYVRSVHKACGPVFSVMAARQMLFAEATFAWQQLRRGRPGDLFGTDELAILETPWPNGQTDTLLARMIQDVDLGGNAYIAREGTRLRRLRPDWVRIVLSAPPAEAVESDVVGYVYTPGGGDPGPSSRAYLVEEIAHWAPIPDPEAQFRGMSWLGPVISEITSDKAATRHKAKFFENGATPLLAISLNEKVTPEQFRKFKAHMNEGHAGVENAYKNLFLGGGADVKVVGADLQQLDFKATQGAGETRIASAGGIHPVIVGMSEGLAGSSLNAGNFASARRLAADRTLRPLWRSACGALQTILTVPPRARLWIDTSDIAFLREDEKDAAEIQALRARTIRQLVDAGYEPESVVAAVEAGNYKLLVHSGLYSVQLQKPGAGQPNDNDDDGQEGGGDADE